MEEAAALPARTREGSEARPAEARPMVGEEVLVAGELVTNSFQHPGGGTEAVHGWHRLPAGETLTEERRRIADALGLDAEWQWRKFAAFDFRNFQGIVDRAWERWCLKAVERGEAGITREGCDSVGGPVPKRVRSSGDLRGGGDA